jgi:hypothetical protein
MTEYHHSDRDGYAGATPQRTGYVDRSDINRARQAAEALFAPKAQGREPAAPDRSTDQTVRRPRILSAVPPRIDNVKEQVDPVPSKLRERIPGSHLARIRTFLKYGMTIPQVAEVYGVTIGDVETILRTA